ncbi:MAG: DUF22 domain-containing protein [Methanobacterium sp.]|nr:DUF22 domain-containing protein [Methanobacterium sp.]
MVRIIPRLDQVKKELAEHSHRALDFNIGTISGDLRAIIADEDKKYKAGQIKSIRIKHIKIKANDICFLSAYGSNKYGHALAVGEETSLPISMDRSADTALFAAAMDCKIEENDLLGVLILLPVELTH